MNYKAATDTGSASSVASSSLATSMYRVIDSDKVKGLTGKKGMYINK